MTYLLLQTFLLLLSSYFLGAFLSCMTKRTILSRSARMATVTARTAATPVVAAPVDIAPLARPRDIDPVQPKIDLLPRPVPHVIPAVADADISRFDRALTGPDPNAGMPRKMIVEIRPAILKSPTGPAQPLKPKPAPVAAVKVEEPPKPEAAKTEAPKPDAAKVEPAKPQAATAAQAAAAQAAAIIGSALTQKPVGATAQSVPATKPAFVEPKQQTPSPSAAQPSSPEPSPPGPAPSGLASSGMAAGAAGAAAAAAAAVSAAKAAAASVMPRAVTPAPQPQKPAVIVAPAAPPQATVTVKPDGPAPAKPAQSEDAPKPAPSQPSAPPTTPAASAQTATPQSVTGGVDDLLRIRAIDAETERRLHGLGIRRFEDIARWTPADINRVNQALGLTGRIDREQWIEQAQILAKGGETYYSRNRASAARSGATPTQSVASGAAPSVAPAAAPVSAPAAQPPSPQPAAATPAKPASPSPSLSPSPAPASKEAVPTSPPVQSSVSNANLQGKSVTEMAAAAAAAIAAASASVTRGIRPIEPISPMTRANPNVVMPAKLSDAIKEKDSKAVTAVTGATDVAAPKTSTSEAKSGSGKTDDLKRIRGIGVLIEKRLYALGVTTYGDVANWTSGDIDRISQTLDFKGRIERENWVEQARILSSGGNTEFSRRVDRGDVESSRDDD